MTGLSTGQPRTLRGTQPAHAVVHRSSMALVFSACSFRAAPASLCGEYCRPAPKPNLWVSALFRVWGFCTQTRALCRHVVRLAARARSKASTLPDDCIPSTNRQNGSLVFASASLMMPLQAASSKRQSPRPTLNPKHYKP